VYEFNLLVSCPWSLLGRARREIADVLKSLGDERPVIERTVARGIIGVKTSLDSREVIKGLQNMFTKDPLSFQYTLKWVPTDLWTYSDMNSMKEAVMNVRERIRAGERWRMTVEKRRYTLYHKIDIIKQLAELLDEKVDLKNPDKILRIDILGKYAAVSVLSPKEVFSTMKLPPEEGQDLNRF